MQKTYAILKCYVIEQLLYTVIQKCMLLYYSANDDLNSFHFENWLRYPVELAKEPKQHSKRNVHPEIANLIFTSIQDDGSNEN